MPLSRNIYVTQATRFDGTNDSLLSTKPLSDTSIRINTKANRLLLLVLMRLAYPSEDNPYFELSVIKELIHYRKKLTPDVWTTILDFLPGFTQDVGNYALKMTRPSIFMNSKNITTKPFTIVDAAIRGEETLVLNILETNLLYLCEKAKIKNSVCVEHDVTPFQAAIMTTDAQMAVEMKKYFDRIPDGNKEMQKQTLEIYRKSLNAYCEKQKAIKERLEKLKADKNPIDEKILSQAQSLYDTYSTTLENNDINEIFKTHQQAQIDNTFDFQPYCNAIFSASEQELNNAIVGTSVSDRQTDEARKKLFEELTLVEKLNRFREEFVKHRQEEIIFNPRHILAVLQAWNTLKNRSFLGYDKALSLFYTQVYGWMERMAEEPVKQDIRQGIMMLVELMHKRSRPSCFNRYSLMPEEFTNDVFDITLSNAQVISGLGYQFAMGLLQVFSPYSNLSEPNIVKPAKITYPSFRSIMLNQDLCFLKYIDNTNRQFQELLIPVTRRQCAIQ